MGFEPTRAETNGLSVHRRIIVVFKIPVFSEILTRIAEFKLQIAIHYNIEPIKKRRR